MDRVQQWSNARTLMKKCFMDLRWHLMQTVLFDSLIMFEFSGVSMHVLNLRVQETGKLANKWNKKFVNEMKWKGEYKKTFQSNYGLCIKYKNQQIIEKRKIFKKKQKNKQRNKNGKFPGSGSLSWLGPHSRSNALPTELRGTYHD